MVPKRYSIPKGSLVLVTGANSYIGSNIIDHLLELGYNVRGAVRAPKPWLNELFVKKHGSNRFETVIIPVLEREGALDDAMNGVSGIVHVVSIAIRTNY
jgi:nucleoside-diphosphate-sugar epimerase